MTAFQSGPGGQRRRPDPERGQSGQQPGLSPQDARKIVEGDVEFLIQQAQRIADRLREASPADGEGASFTQLRRLYGEVKRIQMLWERDAKAGRNRLLLLKPRLRYQVARERNKGRRNALETFASHLEAVLDSVGQDDKRFQHFVEFFEAIVAYAR